CLDVPLRRTLGDGTRIHAPADFDEVPATDEAGEPDVAHAEVLPLQSGEYPGALRRSPAGTVDAERPYRLAQDGHPVDGVTARSTLVDIPYTRLQTHVVVSFGRCDPPKVTTTCVWKRESRDSDVAVEGQADRQKHRPEQLELTSP